ncbi:MAG: hypothetical protein HPY80_13050 [Bacteroidales bacterium]|jgi:hypothetical protein|nr:hypothetical protein [Bacteroidales bacterium]
MEPQDTSALFELLKMKGELKEKVYQNTQEAFTLICRAAEKIARECPYAEEHLKVEFLRQSALESELFFAGDALIFLMHTNIFEFSRDHEVMRMPYIREDKERSYCGVIHVYNFLSDSFKYNRYNDLGYLIGRIFVNKDMHYFIDGKREVGILYPNFGTEVLDEDAAFRIVSGAMTYAINFDLLTPPFDEVKIVNAGAVRDYSESSRMITAKRLGFRFQADKD